MDIVVKGSCGAKIVATVAGSERPELFKSIVNAVSLDLAIGHFFVHTKKVNNHEQFKKHSFC